jgi:hypothetical protein
MAEVLQEINFNEEVDVVQVSVFYKIKSELFSLESLSKELAVKPTRLWNKGEDYLGKQFNKKTQEFEQVVRKRPFSIWEIDSSCFISSKRVEEHVKYLVELLSLKKDIINRILCDKDYMITVNILKKSYAEVIDYQIDPRLLEKLLSFCKNVSFTNYYIPPNNEDVEP